MSFSSLYRPIGVCLRQGVRSFSATGALLKKTKVDPELPVVPKGASSAFALFTRDWYTNNKSKLEESPTKLSVSKLGVAVGEAWHALADSAKQEYAAGAAESKKTYEVAYKAFYDSLDTTTKKAIEKARGKKLPVPGGKSRAKAELASKPGYPGPPLTPFFVYLSEVRQSGEFDGSDGDKKSSTVRLAKEAGLRWKAMSDSEKQVYKDRSDAQVKKYKEWTESQK
ncbi:hypothetical protein M231_03422 [Tremella mesenterica]|uniref:HMG box domain-containing protein n=1 Tax=Tremella mesenterica TaxID=5217 RepID=A0A4Q1BN99_TREME|nr:uncharacterized protein TREMEDRAFT_68095 [Tremella mesenterica DSM 1558]EIW70507.1 hypothetical protein TREMEDRAFT_68095 [Tremella mesenterica DSM 1558]RXK39343.1 hypothetical protein M231_03422 [Tremella mesenterica]